MFQWRKIGRIFGPDMIGAPPWMAAYAQAPSAILFDDRVRIFFSTRPPPDARGQYVSHSAWVDLDRSDLGRIVGFAQSPILPLGALGAFDEFGVYPVSVIRDGGRLRAYYGGWTRCESVPFNVAIGCAVSDDDGVTFTRMGPGPVIEYSPDEPFVMSGPKIRRFGERWQLFYIAGKKWKYVDGRPEPVYRIRMAQSDDGIYWEKLGRDLIPPRIEPDEAQASPDVFYRDGVYHMFFCYRHSTDYRGHARGYRIGYAQSDDLIVWRRDDAAAGLEPSPEGWDAEMVSYPHIFDVDGVTYMAYLGDQVGRAGFGLAEWRA